MLAQHACGAGGVDAAAHGDDGVEVVVIKVAHHLAFTLALHAHLNAGISAFTNDDYSGRGEPSEMPWNRYSSTLCGIAGNISWQASA